MNPKLAQRYGTVLDKLDNGEDISNRDLANLLVVLIHEQSNQRDEINHLKRKVSPQGDAILAALDAAAAKFGGEKKKKGKVAEKKTTAKQP